MKRNKYLKIAVIAVGILLLGGLSFGGYKYYQSKKEEKEDTKKDVNVDYFNSPYEMKGNSIEDFDLSFAKLENNEKNMIYSPLSIKYALGMLSIGSSGTSKAQIDAIIGKYQIKKYQNNNHLSFANAFFIKNSFASAIKNDYINTLKENYNAEIVYDTFQNPNNINRWIENKTLHMIENLISDVSEKEFILLNALAIDMDWRYVIQPVSTHDIYDELHTMYGADFYATYPHEDYYAYVSELDSEYGYHALDFNQNKMKAKALTIAASINNYDIVGELGEANIRKTVGDAYDKWAKERDCLECLEPDEKNKVLDTYIKELDTGFKDVGSSTDFRFYVDDEVKVFAKELKEYAGINLEYVGIMPKDTTLKKYIENKRASDIENLLGKLKTIELKNFSKGKITKIEGYIPIFKFDYSLDFENDLNKLGITDVFDANKVNLTKITDKPIVIDEVKHKANIEFSNEGIKAAAATFVGGAGDDTDIFEYLYEVPVEIIDLTFDNPYLFIIRDKDSGEVWFVGSVYEPTIHTSDDY